MIYYFSGTGNSKWVAEQLAVQTHDEATDLIKTRGTIKVEGLTIGLVFPIYAWGIPEPVKHFLNQLTGKPSFAFGVCTCGSEAGKAMDHLQNIWSMNSTYSVVMPSNYIIGAPTESEGSIHQKIAQATTQLQTMASQINDRRSVKAVTEGKFAEIKSSLVAPSFNRFARRTGPFFATERCISCGECVENCPAQTINLIDGKPHWGKKCYQCTACINGCPVQAIEYGKGTATRTRYLFKNYQPKA